jgi:hypothetical protein
MATKYIKFGLRADKNLSDLENPSQALGNLLDNISTQLDENGDKTGFTTADLSPISGLRNTGLADSVTASGTSVDLGSLNDSLVFYTPVSSPNTTLEVQPRITIQDNISNFKAILGNPPLINGGDGPIAKFIPSSRINPSVTATTTGNSGAVAVASLGTKLYSTLVDATLYPIAEGQDFWNNGIFVLGSKIYPTFPDTYGLIQWTGYLSAYFTQEWESTGLFMIEQDIIDDGSDNNWTTLKSVYSNSFVITNATWSNDGTNTTILLGNTVATRLAQVRYICRNMKVSISGTSYLVTGVNEQDGSCTVVGALTGATATSLTFTWSLSDDLIRTGSIIITAPRSGSRVRVRYTVWWPNPANIGLTANSTYRTKRFAYAIEYRDRLPFSFLYSTYDRNQASGQYSYDYFKNNKANILKQDSSYKIRVNNTISFNYTPPSNLSDIVRSMTAGATTVTARSFTASDSYGKLTANTGSTFSGCEVGDWLVFSTSTNYYAFQLQEIGSDTIVYISKTSGITSGTSFTNGVVFKNLGLVGLYTLSSSGGTQGSLYPLLGTIVSPDNVYPDHLAMGIKLDGTAGFKPLRITVTSAKGSNPKTITTSDYLSNSSALPVSTATGLTSHICAVYSSRGLEDLSSADQCKGVYGREVNATASAGATTITLTTNVGVAVGDYVQYKGLGGIADPVITEGTTVTAVGPGTTNITLSAGIRTGKTLNKAATLIFIKSGDRAGYGTANKEYCVIPLNTAPPFEGTDAGLATTASLPSLIVKNFKFGQLDLTIPSSKITVATGISSASIYFPIIYNGITYKALVQ